MKLYLTFACEGNSAVARNNPRRVSLGGKRAWVRLTFYGCYGDAIAGFRLPINLLISAGPYAVSKISCDN